jgi:hypothetical protein
MSHAGEIPCFQRPVPCSKGEKFPVLFATVAEQHCSEVAAVQRFSRLALTLPARNVCYFPC